MSRSLCVCVDDFGLHEGVNEAVAVLAGEGRITAVSCMTQGPAWASGARLWQGALREQVDLGLHLNLTEPFAASSIHAPLPRLIAQMYLGQCNPQRLRHEISSQIDAFELAIGGPPDFVDGHQHVHQLPHVRQALITELQARYPHHRPWLRNTRGPRPGSLKQRLIAALGSRALSRLAQAHGYPQNAHLLGVYDFQGCATRYASLLNRWLDLASSSDVLMCHPATQASETDPIAEARMGEFQVWQHQSASFMAAHHITLIKLSRLVNMGRDSTAIRHE